MWGGGGDRLRAEKRMLGETVQNGFSVFAEDAENRLADSRGLKHLHQSHQRGAGGEQFLYPQ